MTIFPLMDLKGAAGPLGSSVRPRIATQERPPVARANSLIISSALEKAPTGQRRIRGCVNTKWIRLTRGPHVRCVVPEVSEDAQLDDRRGPLVILNSRVDDIAKEDVSPSRAIPRCGVDRDSGCLAVHECARTDDGCPPRPGVTPAHSIPEGIRRRDAASSRQPGNAVVR